MGIDLTAAILRIMKVIIHSQGRSTVEAQAFPLVGTFQCIALGDLNSVLESFLV